MSAEEQARVKLITLLNVAGGRNSAKRKGEDWHEIAKRSKAARKESANGKGGQQQQQLKGKKRVILGDGDDDVQKTDVKGSATVVDDDAEEESASSSTDPFKIHFATESTLLTPESLAAVKVGKWKTEKIEQPGLGRLTRSKVLAEKDEKSKAEPVMHPRLKEKLDEYIGQQASPALPNELLELVANYQDLFYARTDYDTQDTFRAIVSLHAMSHIQKTRQRILKDNEALAAGTNSERETRDQGFTRPKVLILLPFRNSALAWMEHLTDFSLATQIENNGRFQNDFSLPEGAIDKLASDEKDVEGNSKYPRDHRETFKGNIDDSFRVGIKVTRKSLKLYSEFYQSDLIIASPLGLRMSIEKEKSADFLSSVEIVVADQLDVMGMQNWEHVQFIFKHLNEIPTEAHGCDFSRVKPWYLDGQAPHLRQSILLSSYETPEFRSLFSKQLRNVAGKVRTETDREGVLEGIKSGLKQTFMRFEASSIQTEDDARFDYFTTKTLPALRKSAVASSNTLIFIPSYFDFVRLNAHLKTIEDFDYAVLSEYSSNSEISRARTNFFNGKKSFLIVTERFHFFRRYKIRGARTVVFYAPPEHAEFYAEFLQYPFLKREVSGSSKNRPEAENTLETLEASEVSSQTVFSKYDFLRLERIVGTEDARRMCSQDEGERFSFI